MAKEDKNSPVSAEEQSILDLVDSAPEDTQDYGVTTNVNVETDISPEEEQALDKELILEEKYGKSPVKAAALAAARGLSFGASDVLATQSGLVSPETLSAIKRKNAAASIAGEVVGTAAPLLLSGGTAAPAVGAKLGAKALIKGAGSGVRAANAASLAVEKLTAKALKKAIAETGTETVARKIIEKGLSQAAGSAVEGALYGTGQLLSESALGEADLNAENLAAAAGTGALFGGAAGGLFGLSETIVPTFRNGKVAGYVSKKLDNKVDDVLAAQKLQGMTASRITKQNQRAPQIAENTPAYLRNLADRKEIGIFSNSKKMLNAVDEDIAQIGSNIGKTLDDIDAIAKDTPIMPTKAEVAANAQTRLSQLKETFEGLNTDTAKQSLRKIERAIKGFDDDLAKTTSYYTGKELNKLKNRYQSLAKWDKRGQLPLDEQISREISRSLREDVLNLADKASSLDQNLGQQLRQNLLDYGTATEFVANMSKKVDSEVNKNLINFRDYVTAGAFGSMDAGLLGATAVATRKFLDSDLKQKLLILNKIEKSNQKVATAIDSSISNFAKKVNKVKRPLTTKALLTTSFDIENPKKKAKDKDPVAAFKRISSELQSLQASPEKFMNYLSNSSLQSSGVAPQTAAQLQQTAISAVNFLTSKLPLNPSQKGAIQIMKQRWNPSDIELNKFERYLQVIKEPLTALNHLEAGTLTREHVEALKAVYPNLYGRIQERTLEALAKDPESFDYQQRLKLGILLDIPSDVSLSPDNIQALQEEFKTEQPQETGSTMQRNVDLSFDNNTSTPVEKVQRR